ncbi:hypothetical protein [Metallosphaera hakonensis]|uniref:HEPN domain-containing protein n=1 Tax=Metallosphaera hakonensis JCM 8857 = DSM 7519 TaxID=1293036 RepID=A0A2U9IS71_9CREN|nr:hypothetical protein [Metallosphaera hakonensis]AWR98803.1 hypothetical protein DFR87_02860 [Metallosphaera hakonensis JCM 8857 = DSM 7519]
MNNSALASEYLLRATRTLKESTDAFNEGDLYFTVVRAKETLDNLAYTLLSLYGVLVTEGSPVDVLGYLIEKRELNQETKAVIAEIQDIWRQVAPVTFLNESPTKAPSVLARQAEVKPVLERVTYLFDKVREIFDGFHN